MDLGEKRRTRDPVQSVWKLRESASVAGWRSRTTEQISGSRTRSHQWLSLHYYLKLLEYTLTGNIIHFAVVKQYEINLLLSEIRFCLVFYYGMTCKDIKLKRAWTSEWRYLVLSNQLEFLIYIVSNQLKVSSNLNNQLKFRQFSVIS